MNESELLARIVAQQQHITALHTALAKARTFIDPIERPTVAAEIDAALAAGESDHAAAIEAEIARRVSLAAD